jgi:SAM-dependent methyltransferase
MTNTQTVPEDLWGARARDWAEIEDENSRPLFEAVLDATGVRDGTRLLDVGCGSGLACAIAAGRGAQVSGLDSSAGLIEIACERVPEGDFRVGDMVSLPWEDNSFDAVTFVNSFFFASDREAAFREAGRVTGTGGRIAVISWAPPENVESTAYLAALAPLLPPLPAEINPFIRPAELEELARGAGLEPQRLVDLDWPWEYADRETALRGWLSPGPSTLAIQASGEAAVRDALAQTLEQFRLTDGGYRLENTVHCLIARPGDARGSRR